MGLDAIGQKNKELAAAIKESGVSVNVTKIVRQLKPMQILRDIVHSFLHGCHRSNTHDPAKYVEEKGADEEDGEVSDGLKFALCLQELHNRGGSGRNLRVEVPRGW